MIDETISKLEQRLKNSAAISELNRQELLQLLSTLKTEVSELSKTHADEAQKILGYTQASTQEATHPEKNSERLDLHLQDLAKSVDGLEASHPKLVQLVNRISEILANLGI